MTGLGKDNNGNLRNNIQIFIQYIECVCWISYDRVISCKQKNKMGKKVLSLFHRMVDKFIVVCMVYLFQSVLNVQAVFLKQIVVINYMKKSIQVYLLLMKRWMKSLINLLS